MPVIKTGVFNDHTTGAPLTIEFNNTTVHLQGLSEAARNPQAGTCRFHSHEEIRRI
ncbi:MAG: hypothetical protein R2758_07140 [Bacteroidales bacterium]